MSRRMCMKKNLIRGNPRVALVRQVAGQGAMYDTMVFPVEPSGFTGGVSIIDMNNMPVFLTANEIRDDIFCKLWS